MPNFTTPNFLRFLRVFLIPIRDLENKTKFGLAESLGTMLIYRTWAIMIIPHPRDGLPGNHGSCIHQLEPKYIHSKMMNTITMIPCTLSHRGNWAFSCIPLIVDNRLFR